MIDLKPPLRLATPRDAAALADLVNFAGHGLPLYLWQALAQPGQDPWTLGRTRQAAKAEAGQIVVVDEGGGAIASLTGYVVGATPAEIGPDFPALFRPLQELENQALESWYVNVLACYPAHRGRGIGSRLLRLAEGLAEAEGLGRMSVIVANDNHGARRLYQRHGYREAATAPCVREAWPSRTEDWILLLKAI